MITMEQKGFLDNPTMHGTTNIKEQKESEDTMTTETHNETPANVIPYTPRVPSSEVGGFGIEGLESLDRTDVVLPRKTILQPTSKKEGDVGTFYDNLTQQSTPEIECVILSITHTRSLWSGDPSDERPECTAIDGITGTRYGGCASCQFNPANNQTLWEKGQKRCGPGYLILAAERPNDTMFIFSALKTSAKPIKPLITAFVQKRKPPFWFLTRLETLQQKNDLGKFYTVKPSIVLELSAADAARYREMYLSMQGATIHDVDEDEMPSESAPDFDANGDPF